MKRAEVLAHRNAGQRLLIALVALPGMATAADTLAVSISPASMGVGKIVRDSGGSTSFAVASDGSVTVTGNGVRTGTGSFSNLSLSLTCTQKGSTACGTSSGNRYTVTVTANTATGGGAISVFSYGSLSSGAALSGTVPSPASPLSITFSVSSWPVTLKLGYTYVVGATAARGAASAPYTVTFAQTQ